MKHYSNKLKNLRKHRNNCDYFLPSDFEISMGIVEICNRYAKRLITNSTNIGDNLPMP